MFGDDTYAHSPDLLEIRIRHHRREATNKLPAMKSVVLMASMIEPMNSSE